ncbi:MAG: Cobalamin synthase [uncultured Solirubrobacteraceae bacterium]|uniref:Adenosylcobinamide-GDP ribazoletransferase n=1 Tax=uncultured Solirubrobacteraceae bacterium TaxID=1162706 RepID=A0A6J4TUE7_9ACTN|nr:MAG: Cobalamin synthase [uncultured Solirubrobacteraceae bacterium]
MSIVDEARAAVGLLTVVPVGRRALRAGSDTGAALWFPLVGGLVGVLAAAAYGLGEALLGSTYGAALALTVSAILTGGLHHDGLADTADGLGVRGDRARRLAVMRDSGIGAFGALALIAFALLAVAALARLAPPEAAGALIAGHALGRWAALAQLTFVAPARADGLGAAFAAGRLALAIGSVLASAIALVSCGIGAGLCAIAGAVLAAAAGGLLARGAFGGRTGDTLGAAVLLTELVVYSVAAAYLVT